MKLQFNAIDNSVLENSLKVTNLSEEKIQKMIALHKSHLMNEGEVKNYLLSVHPSMTKLFEVWNKSQMDHFTLTSVGIAIAHANLRRKTKASFDLGIWIN